MKQIEDNHSGLPENIDVESRRHHPFYQIASQVMKRCRMLKMSLETQKEIIKFSAKIYFEIKVDNGVFEDEEICRLVIELMRLKNDKRIVIQTALDKIEIENADVLLLRLLPNNSRRINSKLLEVDKDTRDFLMKTFSHDLGYNSRSFLIKKVLKGRKNYIPLLGFLASEFMNLLEKDSMLVNEKESKVIIYDILGFLLDDIIGDLAEKDYLKSSLISRWITSYNTAISTNQIRYEEVLKTVFPAPSRESMGWENLSY